MKAKWTCALCHESDVPRLHPRKPICELCIDSLAARGLAWCTGRGLRRGHRVRLCDLSGQARKRPWCRACERAWQQEHQPYAARRATIVAWREKNADHVRTYRRNYNQRNHARLAHRRSIWRAANRERIRAQQRAWNAANPGIRRAYRDTQRAHVAAMRRRLYLRKKVEILRSLERALSIG